LHTLAKVVKSWSYLPSGSLHFVQGVNWTEQSFNAWIVVFCSLEGYGRVVGLVDGQYDPIKSAILQRRSELLLTKANESLNLVWIENGCSVDI
jgi:hypothetical protein